jgi:hypothetical protein
MRAAFQFMADAINGAERSFLDFLSAIVPYAVPLIPAYLTYFHTQDQMNFPWQIAFSAAFVVEVLGITAVSTSIRFYRYNMKYTAAQNKAPFVLAIFTYVFYLVIVLSVNVVLELVADTRSGWVIFSIGLFSLLSVPSGILISIRTQFSEMLEERTKVRTNLPRIYAAQTTQGFTGQRAQKERKLCACGCGLYFTGRADKMYIDNTHRMRHQRAKD